jgi:hypothetical protein
MPFKARYANTGAGVSGASRICDASASKAWFLLSQSSIVFYVEDSRVSAMDCRTLANCGMFIFHQLWFSVIDENRFAEPRGKHIRQALRVKLRRDIGTEVAYQIC